MPRPPGVVKQTDAAFPPLGAAFALWPSGPGFITVAIRMEPMDQTSQARQREVLRQASVALDGRLVTMWRVSEEAEVVPEMTSVVHPPYHAAKLDLDGTLRRWGIPIIEGSRWVGCRLDGGRWCVASVRTEPAAPPPDGVERRSRERITLELAGLCLGTVDRPAADAPPGLPEPRVLHDLWRQPGLLAHEVASPLTAAMAGLDGCMAAVREAPALEPTTRSDLLAQLAGVTDGVQRAIDFLRAVQDQARGALARFERFDAVQAVRSCVQLERPLAKRRGVAVALTTAVDSLYLQGDPSALGRILTNLVRNAVDAMEGRTDQVAVALEQVGSKMQVSVSDTGRGIPSELLARVFEPGFTTKQLGKGSGMGLTVVRETVRAMFSGSVKLESAVGRGTTVTVTLPIPPQRES